MKIAVHFPFKMQIPYHRYDFGAEEQQAVLAAMASGWLTTGARVAEFETRFAAYKRASAAVGVTSCTAGLSIVLANLPLQSGDEIITTPLTFAASANVIVQRGCRAAFVDIDPRTLNIDPNKIEQSITDKTRAIIVVHLCGNMCDMDAIMSIAQKHNLYVIEDCAHAIEAEYRGRPSGTFGVAGCFSFYPNKNMTTGEGGMIIVSDPELAHPYRVMRNHGMDFATFDREKFNQQRQYDILAPGYKYNMNEIQGALGTAQLAKIDQMWGRRVQIFERYAAAFDGHPLIDFVRPDPLNKPAHHLFVVRLTMGKLKKTRAEIMAEINAAGVQLSGAFKPVSTFTFYQKTFGYREGDFPLAEDNFNRAFALPFYPLLTDEQVDYIVQTVLAVVEGATN